MGIRIALARSTIRLGKFIESLAIMIMTSDTLVDYSRQHYSSISSVETWGAEGSQDKGLSQNEISLLEANPIKEGKALVLCVGGGREAITLAQMGFEVTGVDFIPEMVQKAKENVALHGFEMEGLVQDISKLEAPEGSYDVVWLSASMYSCVPTRRRRVEMLRKIRNALRPGGCFICQFCWGMERVSSRKTEIARKLFAFSVLGNTRYEKGDMLWGNVEFIHAFLSEDAVRSEFEEGGFEIIHIDIPGRRGWGGVVLKRT